ncbi:PEP-CTERM sorting domain-containing protein [Piscinibacter terrae]|uniref:PEP-CTERM sorting domain-containing protein n=1 Tax=Piscinibacter terrae TaxID=2496871 RepID=A0A3N7IWW0_9BURK|nr:PEP-CTERM sorting domain-containing protein [Albitalea terrae]RQP23272.1 PEP-CTERM sorting domain-containing protein [Albitalea terrae]
MRTLAAALLLACSAAHAGSFTVTMADPKLSLVDLDASDATSPTLTLSPGESLAPWNTSFSFGGEFWTDYDHITPSPLLHLSGTLDAHSGIDWSGAMVYDTQLLLTATDDERLLIMGGGGGITGHGFSSYFELPPYFHGGTTHVVDPVGFFLRNDSDEATTFSLDMGFSTQTITDLARPVPEPSSYLMMLGGLALLPLARRKLKAGSR